MYTGAPIYYDHRNAIISAERPGTVHTIDNATYHYFRRYLLQKAMSVFRWRLPDWWSMDYFLYALYCWGVVAVIETDRFGVIPQGCGLKGYDVQYQPTHAVIANQLLKGITSPRIGTECVLFKLKPDFGGIMDLVGYYAEAMTLASQSMSINILNSKLSYVFTANNKAAAESFKKLYDQMAEGQPAVVQDKNLLLDDGRTPAWTPWAQDVGSNYIADRLLTDLRKLEAEFDTKIGLPSANTDKRERLISDEVNANAAETYAPSAADLERWQKECLRVSDLFGVDMWVDWRVNPAPEGVSL